MTYPDAAVCLDVVVDGVRIAYADAGCFAAISFAPGSATAATPSAYAFRCLSRPTRRIRS